MSDNKGEVVKRLYSLKNSFYYASSGIVFCFKYEKNMRIHLIIALYVLYFSRFYTFSRAEFAIIVLICVLVMSLEMINTAIEVVMDKVSPNYSTLAKISKDVAAGAVFIAAMAACVIGFVLFYNVEVMEKIIDYFGSQLSNTALLIASGILSITFIEMGKTRRTARKTRKND